MFNLLCAESPECSRIDQKISLFFGLFGRKRTIDQNSLVYFGQSRALPFATSDSTATQHRPKTTPIRHCRDSLATVSHRCCTGNIKTSPVSPVRQWRTKSLACTIHSLQARLCPLSGETIPVPIPTWLISLRLSMLLWGLPPADSTSPCAAAWDCWGRTAQSASGAPSNSAGSRSDSR